MKLEISVPEVVSIFKGIQEQPEKLFTMIRTKILYKEKIVKINYTKKAGSIILPLLLMIF